MYTPAPRLVQHDPQILYRVELEQALEEHFLTHWQCNRKKHIEMYSHYMIEKKLHSIRYHQRRLC